MNHHLLSWMKETFLGGELADNFVIQDFILPIHQLQVRPVTKPLIILYSGFGGVWHPKKFLKRTVPCEGLFSGKV